MGGGAGEENREVAGRLGERIEVRGEAGVSVGAGGVESGPGRPPLRERLAALAAIIGEDHWGDDVVAAVRSIRSDEE